jgi:hypothetical protein
VILSGAGPLAAVGRVDGDRDAIDAAPAARVEPRPQVSGERRGGVGGLRGEPDELRAGASDGGPAARGDRLGQRGAERGGSQRGRVEVEHLLPAAGGPGAEAPSGAGEDDRLRLGDDPEQPGGVVAAGAGQLFDRCRR